VTLSVGICCSRQSKPLVQQFEYLARLLDLEIVIVGGWACSPLRCRQAVDRALANAAMLGWISSGIFIGLELLVPVIYVRLSCSAFGSLWALHLLLLLHNTSNFQSLGWNCCKWQPNQPPNGPTEHSFAKEFWNQLRQVKKPFIYNIITEFESRASSAHWTRVKDSVPPSRGHILRVPRVFMQW